MTKPVVANIDEMEPLVAPIIEQIGEKSFRPGLFRDIQQACRKSKAFLFVGSPGTSFAVLRPMPAGVVQVWVAYSDCGDAVERFLPGIKELCREVGATQIEFETAIDSVERLMPRHGWKKAYTVWRQDLNEI